MTLPIQTENVVITLVTGEVRIMSFITFGRGDSLPQGATWAGNNSDSGYWHRPTSPENIQAEVLKTFGSQALSWEHAPGLVRDPEEPTTYHAARTWDGKKIGHDMTKAREIHLGRLRSQREEKFKALDGEWMRAQGQGKKAEADAIEAKRQQLRDLPDVNMAQTLEELKAVRLPEV